MNMKPSEDFNRLSNVLEAAETAFWKVVADSYPEATSGDFSPYASLKFSEATEAAVVDWLESNADNAEPDWRTTEILLHNIEYIHDNIVIGDEDAEHIAYCISQGIREGELTDDDGGQAGYWRINNG
jgi:hypothetical protein